MQWPSRAEYTEAVRDYPHISLRDSKLRGGKPRRGKDNFVVSDTGAFSIVFPIDMVSKTFALRCWVKDVGNAKNRYEKISAYLKQVGLLYFVDFEYVPAGILVNGIKYPITRMEWVEGVSLREFIEQKQNLQNPHIFKVVADEFKKMVAAFHKREIAHGDLQDGNILLKRNSNGIEIKLIDYDSFFVPTLRGQPDQILGLPEYQHPKRIMGGRQANEKVDYFSELVIYLSFLSLAEKPELWSQFKTKTERGLLFSKEDFENTRQSAVFRELANLSPDVQQLTATLKDFCAKTSIDELEPLETILPKLDANTYCTQGESFLSDDCYDEALSEFQKAIDIKPNYARAYFGCGHVYRRTKRYTNAIIAFQQAIKFKPNYKVAHYGLALVYLESGNNSKAKTAVHATLKIDPHYQPAHQLLDAIKSATSPKPKPSSPDPTPPPDPKPNIVTNLWQYIIGVLKNSWHSVAAGALALALVVCFIAFLTENNEKGTVLSQNTVLTKKLTQKESKIRQKELEIQGLTSRVRLLESANQKLNRDNGKLKNKLENRTSGIRTASGDVTRLRRQLNEEKNENQELQAQLTKKNTEMRQLQNDKAAVLNENQKLKKQLIRSEQGTTDKTVTIRRLEKEKTETLTTNRRLQKQLAEKTSEAKRLIDRVQQLQDEKIRAQRRNQELQGENADLVRQNRSLRNENTSLRNQPDKPNRRDANHIASPEPPRKIHDYRNVVTRAGVYNNHGILSLEKNEYNKAIAHFRAAIKVDSKFEVAYYNLGCTFLEMKDYPKAISAFSDAVGVNRKFKEAYYNLGLAHLGKGAYSAAKSSAELALRIDKNYQHAHNLLATIEKVQR